ncbi:MAG: LacI family DNA-binding transcriptional regulator [Ardenticatenaceae bacterium]|nr:LacI family DNA-binding transcriptional regulator [Ardenticatenaceae bacterium]
MSEENTKRNNVTIFDVAKEAGVSYSTVSRVVNNFQFVKSETRERVQAAMDKLGYVANLKARSLAGGRSQMLGLLLYDFESSYQVEIVRGIDAEVSALDYDLMLYTTHHRRRKESTLVAKLTQGLVDGLLIVLPSNLEAYLADLDGRNFPYVLIDHAGTGTTSNTVKAKNWEGSFEATSYLASLGHRRIGFVKGIMVVDSAKERLAGYEAALAQHGLAVDAALIQPGDFAWQTGYDAAHNLLALAEPPTAVIAASDACAFGVIEGLLAQGVRVPEDVSVVGFDDIPEARAIRPSLTTMRQDLRQMGRIATRILVNGIEDPDLPTEQVELDMELIVRESTCPPVESVYWRS